MDSNQLLGPFTPEEALDQILPVPPSLVPARTDDAIHGQRRYTVQDILQLSNFSLLFNTTTHPQISRPPSKIRPDQQKMKAVTTEHNPSSTATVVEGSWAGDSPNDFILPQIIKPTFGDWPFVVLSIYLSIIFTYTLKCEDDCSSSTFCSAMNYAYFLVLISPLTLLPYLIYKCYPLAEPPATPIPDNRTAVTNRVGRVLLKFADIMTRRDMMVLVFDAINFALYAVKKFKSPVGQQVMDIISFTTPLMQMACLSWHMSYKVAPPNVSDDSKA